MKSSNYNLQIKPLDNAYFLPIHKKMKIKIENYFTSQSFNVDTFGMSSSIRLNLKENKVIKKSHSIEMPKSAQRPNEIEERLFKHIELGTYMTTCPHPYSRTKMLKFVPRYFIINKLDVPIIIKEKGSTH